MTVLAESYFFSSHFRECVLLSRAVYCIKQALFCLHAEIIPLLSAFSRWMFPIAPGQRGQDDLFIWDHLSRAFVPAKVLLSSLNALYIMRDFGAVMPLFKLGLFVFLPLVWGEGFKMLVCSPTEWLRSSFVSRFLVRFTPHFIKTMISSVWPRLPSRVRWDR